MTNKTTVQPVFKKDMAIAELFGVSCSFLRHDRRGKRLIPYMRLGGGIYYDPEQVRQAMLALQEGGQSKRRKTAAT
jgi:hypothetical protein